MIENQKTVEQMYISREGLKRAVHAAGSDAGRCMKLLEARQAEMKDGVAIDREKVVMALKKSDGLWPKAAKLMGLD